MTKDKKIEKLIEHCKEVSRLHKKSKEKSEGLQRMAQLARLNQKDTDEFKELNRKYLMDNTVIDFSDPIVNIAKIVDTL